MPLQGQLCNVESRPNRGTGRLPPGILDPEVASDASGYSVPYRLILLVLLAAFAVFLVAVPIVKWILRRRAFGRPTNPVHGCSRRIACSTARRRTWGWAVATARRSRSIASGSPRPCRFSDGHLVRLTDATTRAAYAPDLPTSQDADRVARDARVAVRDLRKDAGVVRRILGTYRPGL